MSKIAFASVALIALVPLFTQACGGTNDVTIGEDGTSRSDAAATTSPTQTSPTGSTTTAPVQQDASPPPVPDAAPDAPVCPTYYQDEDADGFGGAIKQVTCTPPGAGWVDKGGDCNDTNKSVFPGQTLFFGLPIGGGGAGTSPSFDYDCSTKEEAGPALPKAGTCTVGVGGCSGAGYLPAEPARPVSTSIDPYCGSARYRFCRLTNGQCVPVDGQTDKAYDCH
jgi:hypothetical protein